MANPFGKKPPIKDAAHYPNLFRSVRTRRNKFWGRWYGWLAIGLVAVMLFGGGFAFWYINALEDAGQVDVPGTEEEKEGEPKTVLLVGSDSREGLTPEEQQRLGADPVGGERADTLIVARIDPETDRVTMVQFPRDYYITLPDGGQGRINEGLAGGRGYMVRTVEELTGLDINDYIGVDIAGFKNLVDAVGGIEICLTEPVPYDENTGIEITEDEVPGMVEFDGDRAINYVRTRKVLPGGDFDRIRNQQRFLAAAIDKLTSAGTIFRPDRLFDIKNVVENNVRFSNTLGLQEIRRIARRMSNINPDTYEVYTAPNLGTMTTDGGLSVVEPDLPAMRYLFKKIAKDESAANDGIPDIPPSEITVGVYNGSGVEGAATTASTELIEATRSAEGEIEVAEVDDADRDDYGRTVVTYAPGAEEKAEFIAAALPKAKVKEGKTPGNIDVTVVVGSKFSTKRVVQVTPIEIPEPGETPEACT